MAAEPGEKGCGWCSAIRDPNCDVKECTCGGGFTKRTPFPENPAQPAHFDFAKDLAKNSGTRSGTNGTKPEEHEQDSARAKGSKE